jgi:hypothetical protein
LRGPFLALALVLVASPAVAASPPPGLICPTNVGGRVVLISDAVDPDVMVWKSRDQMVDYTGGHWGSTSSILAHTMVAKQGTRATVIACYPGIAHPKNASSPMDAIGIRMVSGEFRGQYGWVLSSDLHPDEAHAAPSPSSSQQSK